MLICFVVVDTVKQLDYFMT